MNERDKELWEKSQQWDSSDDGRGKLKILESVEKFADLIRADAMEAATRAANESWTLMCKKMVGLEREACAKVCENEAKEHERNTYDARDGRYDWQADGANACAAAIRARGNT